MYLRQRVDTLADRHTRRLKPRESPRQRTRAVQYAGGKEKEVTKMEATLRSKPVGPQTGQRLNREGRDNGDGGEWRA